MKIRINLLYVYLQLTSHLYYSIIVLCQLKVPQVKCPLCKHFMCLSAQDQDMTLLKYCQQLLFPRKD